MRLRFGAALVAVLATGFFAASAVGDEVVRTNRGTTYVSAKQTLITGAEGTIDARCPNGTHVWSGGFASDTGKVVAYSSVPYDGPDPNRVPDDGWAVHLKASAPDQGKVFAFCRSQKVIYAEHRRSAGAGGYNSNSAHCPRGTSVVGGGGASGSGALVSSFPYDSGDTNLVRDNGWRVRAFRLSDGRSTAWAVCEHHSGARVVRGAGRTSVDSGATRDLFIGCGGPEAALGGGVQVLGSIDGVDLIQSTPTFSDALTSRGWLGELRNRGDESARVLVTTVCH